MDDLPLELVHEILKNIKIKDLCCLRLLSKKWDQTILGFRVKEHLEIISEEETNVFNHKTNRLWLSKLKSLTVNIHCEYGINIEQINKLTELEYLNIKGYNIENEELKLPELKILRIRKSAYDNLERKNWLSVNCPKLSSVRLSSDYDGQRYLKSKYYETSFVHPESVTHLIIPEYKTFEVFKSCKIIEYWGVIEKISAEQFLSRFPNLEELHLYNSYPFYYWQGEGYIFGDLPPYADNECSYVLQSKRPYLNELLIQKEKLQMNNLKIYLKGTEISKSRGILQDDGLEEKKLSEFIVENQKYTKGLDFKEFTYYNSMIKFDFPISFVEKLSKVYRLKTCQAIKDENHFLSFIEKLWRCSDLNELHLDETLISQSFVDRLPAICSLKILNLYDQKDLKLNFDFLIRMKNLKEFDTNQKISLETIKQKLSSIESEKKFDFYFNGPVLKVFKDNKTYVVVKHSKDDKTIKKFKKLNELINFLKENSVLEELG